MKIQVHMYRAKTANGSLFCSFKRVFYIRHKPKFTSESLLCFVVYIGVKGTHIHHELNYSLACVGIAQMLSQML